MARRSLRPELNRIRAWVRQGRTDAWIAHQLEVTVQQIQAFRREHDLDEDAGDGVGAPVDLRRRDRSARRGRRADRRGARGRRGRRSEEEDEDVEAGEEAEEKPKRRRGRRGGRRTRRKPVGALEATFDHGEEGYGLWLDPAVQDDPTYAEYSAGHRPVEVTIEEDQIVIRRAGEEDSDDDGDGD